MEEDLRFPMNPTGTTDVDDVSWFSILDSEIRSCGSHKSEGSSVV